MRGLIAALALLGVFVSGMSGCGGGRAADDGVLRRGNGDEPQDLDPHVVTGLLEHRILTALFEGLVKLDPATLEPVPAVAAAWEVSDDALVYTFTIREDAKWSNGDPVTAQDFLYGWRRILSPKLASEYYYMLFCMENAEAFYNGEVGFEEVGAKALDARTLQVTLAHPTPYLLAMQIHYSWFPVHQATIEKFGAMDQRGTRWTRAGNLVGNGPFTLTEWTPNKRIRVEPNPEYWNVAALKLTGVEFYPISSNQTEERSFRTGGLHLTGTVPLNKIEVYVRNEPEKIHLDPVFGAYFYRFNCTRKPFDDPRVRRALALAVDREQLVTHVTKGGELPAGYLTPPGAGNYVAPEGVGRDIEEARRLLAEAGYPEGRGFPKVELLYNTQESHREIAQAIQHMWKRDLNVEVGLVNQDWKVYLNSMNRLDYDMARSAWYGDYLDPNSFLDCFVTDGGNNRTGWSSAAYDALIARAAHERDLDARNALFYEAESILLDELPILPLFIYTEKYLKDPALKGWHSNVLSYTDYTTLYFDPE
jgi:oligopeptide transport system substrate-binding protein